MNRSRGGRDSFASRRDALRVSQIDAAERQVDAGYIADACRAIDAAYPVSAGREHADDLAAEGAGGAGDDDVHAQPPA